MHRRAYLPHLALYFQKVGRPHLPVGRGGPAKPTCPPKAVSTAPRAASPYHDLPPATHKDLAAKLEEMEKTYDGQFRLVFDAMRQLMTPPASNPILKPKHWPPVMNRTD